MTCKETVAHAALLAEVRRLRGTRWTPQADARLVDSDGPNAADRLAALRKALGQEQDKMRRNVRRMNDLDEPTTEEIAAFREVSAGIAARIRRLAEELATVAQQVENLPALQAIREKLVRTEVGPVLDALPEQGEHKALRDLI